jgi:hypothetical protein
MKDPVHSTPIYNITYVYNMDKQLPINFYHACTLLYQYCQQYASNYEPLENRLSGSTEAQLGGILQKLNANLQEKHLHDVSAASTLAMKALKHRKYRPYIHVLQAHGYVYHILDIVTYIDTHLYDLPDDFWTNKDDVNMREYNPFQSPRADSGVTNASGRNTPVDVREPFISEQALRSVSVALARLRELSIDC